MANFNWHIESYRKGRATFPSDYIGGHGQWSERDDVVATGCGNLPGWCSGNPRTFFAAADIYERSNGAACRQLVVSLPRELSVSEWIPLVEAFIQRDMGGKPHQYAIHDAHGPADHPHAHIVYSDRIPDAFDRPPETFFSRHNANFPDRGGCKKDSGGKSAKQLRLEVIGRKKRWAEIQNEALEAAGHDVRVEYQSGE